MNYLLNANRDLRNIPDSGLRRREHTIKKLEATYGYSREDAEKVYEMSAVRAVNTLFGASIGLFASYKSVPIAEDLALRWRLFRKPWMRYQVPIAAFMMAYYVGMQIPARIFHKGAKKDPHVSFDHYASEQDLVGKFRLFANDNVRDERKNTVQRLAAYTEDPLSKPELISKLA